MKTVLAQWLTILLKPIAEVRPGERLKTLVMFTYFFFIIGTIWILKPVRNALFLEDLGADNLRFVYIAEGVFLIGIVWLFGRFSKVVSRKVLYGGVLGFYVGCLLVFWVLFHMQVPYLSVLFYVWVSSYSITMTTLFFTLANDLFNPQEAKRLFGVILAGGSAGGFLGAFMTEKLVVLLTTENLLLIVAALVGLCGLLVMWMWAKIAPEEAQKSTATEKEEGKSSTSHHSAGKLLKSSSYLMMLAGIIILAKIASSVVDNQYNGIVELAIQGKDARTAFFGGFGKWLNVASIISQLVFTSVFLRYLGVGISLWILPVGLFLGSTVSVFFPILFVGASLKLIDGSGNYSIQQACREILYLPVPSAIRYKVKPAIDMLGYRLAKSFAGIYIAIFAPLLGLTSSRLGVLILILMPIWAVLVFKMRRGYSEMLRKNITEEKYYENVVQSNQATDVLSSLHDEKGLHKVKSRLRHGSFSTKKIAANAFLTYSKDIPELISVRKQIEELLKDEALDDAQDSLVPKELQQIDSDFLKSALSSENFVSEKIDVAFINSHSELILVRLGNLLQDSSKDLREKRKAVRIFQYIPKQETVDFLLHTLAGIQDHALRFIILEALTYLQDRKDRLETNRFLVKSEIEKEVRIYQQIKSTRLFFKAESVNHANMDLLMPLMKAIEDESVERVFHFLDLLYPKDMMPIIYKYMSQEGDSKRKAYADELLVNTLEPVLLRLIQCIFQERKRNAVGDREIQEVLTKGLESGDRWYSIVSHFLVSEFNLCQRWPQIAKKI